MFDYGHFCLLIFAQGTWKPKYKERLAKETQSNFLQTLEPRSKAESLHLSWAETERLPLFDPMELGKTQRECALCSAIYKIFQEKKGQNAGVILFSHSVPDVIGFKALFPPLLKDPRIKKLFYFELGPETFVIDKTKYLAQLNERTHQCLSESEFFDLLDNDKFQQNKLYEIYKQIIKDF